MEKTKMLPSHKTSEHTTKRQTYKARMFERLCKEEGAWASPKRSLVSRCFVKRRGASKRPKHSLVIRRLNAQQEDNTQSTNVRTIL